MSLQRSTPSSDAVTSSDDSSAATTTPPAPTSATSRSWDEEEVDQAQGTHNVGVDLGFSLIFSDTENLFQCLTSSDTADQWQMPFETLLYPLTVQDVNALHFEPSKFEDHTSLVGAIPRGGGHQAMRDVTQLVTTSSSSVTAAVKAASITPAFLDECLHIFFVRFIPTFPILHRATSVYRECIHTLLVNASAIGSLYIGSSGSIAKGEALWRLAHVAVKTSWQSLIMHHGPYDICKGVQLLITVLLGQIYGALSRNRAIRATSNVFRPLGFVWARHCGMYDIEPYLMENLPHPEASSAEKEHQWRMWAAREIQQRAVLGYYILDGLVAQISGGGASARHVSNPLSLPSREAAFSASTAEEWLVHMRLQQPDRSPFRVVFRSLFPSIGNPPVLKYPFSAFALRVILEGLQSPMLDSDENDIAVGVPSGSDVRRTLAQLHETISMSIHLSATEQLEIPLRWHTICLDTIINSTMLS
ncbi:hypothetical protein AnigIFM62618_005306 [Aspergillus niger]|nr:hypothetical protein AnigIFM62618_005306 [Aspergillus niger]